MTDITNMTDAELTALLPVAPATCADIVAAMAEVGLVGEVAWECGESIGKVQIKGNPRAFIALNRGCAMVLDEVYRAFSHGCARLPHHPEYPAPIESSIVVALLAACRIVND